jgi:cell division septal protein FtsQ
MGISTMLTGHRPWFGVTLLATVVVLTMVAAIGAHRWKADLTVVHVRPEGNRLLSDEDVVALAAIPKKERLFDIDLQAVRRRLLKSPFIEQVAVRRNVPNEITLEIEERIPVAALSADRMLFIDADGVVLPSVDIGEVGDLPLITGAVPAAECVPGKRITAPPVRDALLLLDMARMVSDECYRRISDVAVGPGENLILHTSDFGVPVIVRREDLATQVSKFDGFWRTVVDPRGAADLQYVDLRFEDNVVVRWN